MPSFDTEHDYDPEEDEYVEPGGYDVMPGASRRKSRSSSDDMDIDWDSAW